MDVTAAQRLENLRTLVSNARSMPMSASCVVNRGELLAAIEALAENLPAEIDRAKTVIASTESTVAEGEAEAARIVSAAQERASALATESEVVRVAEEKAAAIVAEAEREADALRTEVDTFVDARMASFESVLAKTTSQVRTARRRLAERSELGPDPATRSRVELPELD